MRLIDADAFDKRLVRLGALSIKSALDEEPTIDAVPVIRCKNCKHSRERNEDERKYLIEGVLICTSPDATDNCWNPVFENHFCSYGERT